MFYPSTSLFIALFMGLFSVACGDRPTVQARPAGQPRQVAPFVIPTPEESTAMSDSSQPSVNKTTSTNAVVQQGTSSGGMDNDENYCRIICNRSIMLGCRKAKAVCLLHCEETRAVPFCRKEMLSIMQCVVKEPIHNWECNDQDIASIKDGFCDDEQAVFMRCLMSISQ
jgi:hypothetical protein